MCPRAHNVPERPGGRGYSGEFGQLNPSAGPDGA
jgi:hypothetical protein